jgi:hypothetical protein
MIFSAFEPLSRYKIQKNSEKFRKIQKNSEKFRKIQKNSEKSITNDFSSGEIWCDFLPKSNCFPGRFRVKSKG